MESYIHFTTCAFLLLALIMPNAEYTGPKTFRGITVIWLCAVTDHRNSVWGTVNNTVRFIWV
jgi:hypothetical protein